MTNCPHLNLKTVKNHMMKCQDCGIELGIDE
jgi:hypothetical protein